MRGSISITRCISIAQSGASTCSCARSSGRHWTWCWAAILSTGWTATRCSRSGRCSPRWIDGLLAMGTRSGARVGESLVDELPLELASADLGPRMAQRAPLRVPIANSPSIHLGEQRPLREHLVAVQPVERIAAQHQVQCRPEDLAQLQVDAPDCAMEIHLVIEIEPR